MPDKSRQIYNLYKSKGLIKETDYETFISANDDQKEALYNLGKGNGLFETTDFNTFSTAFSEPLKKKEDTEPSAISQDQELPQEDSGSDLENGGSDSLKTSPSKTDKVNVSVFEKELEDFQKKSAKEIIDRVEKGNLLDGFNPEDSKRFEGFSPSQIQAIKEDEKNFIKLNGTEDQKQALFNKESEDLALRRRQDAISKKELELLDKISEANNHNKAIDTGHEVFSIKNSESPEAKALSSDDDLWKVRAGDDGVFDLLRRKGIDLKGKSSKDVLKFIDIIRDKNVDDFVKKSREDIFNSVKSSENPKETLEQLAFDVITEGASENDFKLIELNNQIKKVQAEIDENPNSLESKLKLKKLITKRSGFGVTKDIWIDKDGNVVNKSEDKDNKSTSIFNKEFDELSKTFKGSDKKKIADRILTLNEEKKFLESQIGRITKAEESKRREAIENGDDYTYDFWASPGSNQSAIGNRLTKVKAKLAAAKKYYITEQDPSETRGNFFASFADFFVEEMGFSSSAIQTGKEDVQDLISATGDLGIIRDEDEERSKGTATENISELAGEGVKMIVESAIPFGLAGKVMKVAKFAEGYAQGVNFIAKAGDKYNKLKKVSDATTKVLKKAAPYVEDAIQFELAGFSATAAPGETFIEQSAKNLNIKNPVLKYLAKAFAIGTSETTGSLIQNFIEEGEFDISKEELIMNYVMGSTMGLFTGKLGQSRFEEEILNLESKNEEINLAQEYLKAKRELEAEGTQEEKNTFEEINKSFSKKINGDPVKNTSDADVNEETDSSEESSVDELSAASVSEKMKKNKDLNSSELNFFANNEEEVKAELSKDSESPKDSVSNGIGNTYRVVFGESIIDGELKIEGQQVVVEGRDIDTGKETIVEIGNKDEYLNKSISELETPFELIKEKESSKGVVERENEGLDSKEVNKQGVEEIVSFYKGKIKENSAKIKKDLRLKFNEKIDEISSKQEGIDLKRTALKNYVEEQRKSGVLSDVSNKAFDSITKRLSKNKISDLEFQDDVNFIQKKVVEDFRLKSINDIQSNIKRTKTTRKKTTRSGKESITTAGPAINNFKKASNSLSGLKGLTTGEVENQMKSLDELESSSTSQNHIDNQYLRESITVLGKIAKANDIAKQINDLQSESKSLKVKRDRSNREDVIKRKKEIHSEIENLFDQEINLRNEASSEYNDIVSGGREEMILEKAKEKEVKIEIVNRFKESITGDKRFRDKIRKSLGLDLDLDVFEGGGNNKVKQKKIAARMLDNIIDGKVVEFVKKFKDNLDRFDGLIEEAMASSRDDVEFMKKAIINPLFESRVAHEKLAQEVNSLYGKLVKDSFGSKSIPSHVYRTSKKLNKIKKIITFETSKGKKKTTNLTDITPSQAVYIHTLSKNKGARNRLKKYHGFNDDFLLDLENVVTKEYPELVKFSESLQRELFPLILEKASSVHKKTTGLDIALEENYFPIAGISSEIKPIDTIGSFAQGSTNVEAGNFIERKGREIDWEKGMMSVTGKYIESMNRYISFEESVRNASFVFKHRDVQKSLQKLAPGLEKKMITMLQRIANGQGESKSSYMRKFVNIKNRYAVSKLGLNPKVMGSQLLSMSNSMVGENPILFANQSRKIKENWEAFSYLIKSAPFQSRFKGGFDNESRTRFYKIQEQSSDFNDFYSRLSNSSMVTTKLGDIAGALGGSSVKFNLELKRQVDSFKKDNGFEPKGSDLEKLKDNSMKFVFHSVERSQQTANIEGMSLIQGDGGIGELVTSFSSTQIQQQQQIRSAFRNLRRYGVLKKDSKGNYVLNEKGNKQIDKRAYEDLQKIYHYGILQPSLFVLYSQGLDFFEDEDDLKSSFAKSSLSTIGLDGIPVITSIIDNYVLRNIDKNYKFDLGLVPFYDSLLSTYNEWNSLNEKEFKTEKGKKYKKERMEKLMFNMLDVATKLPVSNLDKFILKNIDRYNDDEVNDIREFLGWHPMTLKKSREKRELESKKSRRKQRGSVGSIKSRSGISSNL